MSDAYELNEHRLAGLSCRDWQECCCTPCLARKEIVRLRTALTKIRTAGYNWDATAQWMQKVAAAALEPRKWPDAGEQPILQEGVEHG